MAFYDHLHTSSATIHPGQDALVFPAGNAVALADRVVQVASDAGLRRGPRRAGMRNAMKFNVEVFSVRLDTIYADVRLRSSALNAVRS